MGETKIEWCDTSWNVVSGCTPVSEGCRNCYARTMANRLRGRFGYPKEEPFRVTLHPERLTEPLHWKKPRRVFPCSMSDIFHPDIPDRYRAAVFGIMAATPRHTYMLLTKRPEEALRWYDWLDRRVAPHLAFVSESGKSYWRWFVLRGATEREVGAKLPDLPAPMLWPLPNVWIGVTAENQEMFDRRVPVLMEIPAAVRFWSYEPALGPVDASKHLQRFLPWGDAGGPGECEHGYAEGIPCPKCSPNLDWVIVGPETGPKRRRADHLRLKAPMDRCSEAGVPFFLKAAEIDGRIVKDEQILAMRFGWPVREWPRVATHG